MSFWDVFISFWLIIGSFVVLKILFTILNSIVEWYDERPWGKK